MYSKIFQCLFVRHDVLILSYPSNFTKAYNYIKSCELSHGLLSFYEVMASNLKIFKEIQSSTIQFQYACLLSILHNNAS